MEMENKYLKEDDVICRKCKKFYRITTHYKQAHDRPGFCVKGKMRYNFSLYKSDPCSKSCNCFEFDEYNNETTLIEERIKSEMSDKKYDMWDRRTKIYKAVYNYFKALIEENNEKIGVMKNRDPYLYLQELINSQKEAMFFEWYYFSNIDQFTWLAKRDAVDEEDYYRLLQSIQATMDANISKIDLINVVRPPQLKITRVS